MKKEGEKDLFEALNELEGKPLISWLEKKGCGTNKLEATQNGSLTSISIADKSTSKDLEKFFKNKGVKTVAGKLDGNYIFTVKSKGADVNELTVEQCKAELLKANVSKQGNNSAPQEPRVSLIQKLFLCSSKPPSDKQVDKDSLDKSAEKGDKPRP